MLNQEPPRVQQLSLSTLFPIPHLVHVLEVVLVTILVVVVVAVVVAVIIAVVLFEGVSIDGVVINEDTEKQGPN